MSSNKFRNADLECLRLASDLTQLGRATQNPELRAHCVRMAKFWDDHACRGWADGAAVPNVTFH